MASLFSPSMQEHARPPSGSFSQTPPVSIGVHCCARLTGLQFLSGTSRHGSEPTGLEWAEGEGRLCGREATVLSWLFFLWGGNPPHITPYLLSGLDMYGQLKELLDLCMLKKKKKIFESPDKVLSLNSLTKSIAFRVRIGIHSMNMGFFFFLTVSRSPSRGCMSQ